MPEPRLPCSKRKACAPTTAPARRCSTSALEGAVARRGGDTRPQRRRQDDAAEDAGRRSQPARGSVQLRRQRCHPHAYRAARAPRDRIRAAGARRVRAADGEGESAHRRDERRPRANRAHRRGASRCSRSSGQRLPQQAGTLSGGERKMLAISRALLGAAASADARRTHRGRMARRDRGDRRAPGAAGAGHRRRHRRAARASSRCASRSTAT